MQNSKYSHSTFFFVLGFLFSLFLSNFILILILENLRGVSSVYRPIIILCTSTIILMGLLLRKWLG